MEENKAICFDHNTGTIKTNDDEILTIKDVILIGDGANFPDNNPSKPLEEGLLKVVKNSEGIPNLYQTNMKGKWVKIGEPYDDSMELIYAIIMGK